jgi:hypothetical protein
MPRRDRPPATREEVLVELDEILADSAAEYERIAAQMREKLRAQLKRLADPEGQS